MKPFKISDFLKCLRDIRFMDGTFHAKNQVYQIQYADELTYYEVNHKDYEFVESGTTYQEIAEGMQNALDYIEATHGHRYGLIYEDLAESLKLFSSNYLELLTYKTKIRRIGK